MNKHPLGSASTTFFRHQAGRARRFAGKIRRKTQFVLVPPPIILCYHRIFDPEIDPHLLSVSANHFRQHLEVIKRIASMDHTNPEVIREVEKGLENRLSDIVSQTFDKAGGVEAAASILNLSDRSTEKSILESLETDDPDLVEQIRRLMFVFEDIMLVNDKGIQAVMKEVDNDELALSLKTASDELKEKIFSNMSERAAQLIREDMEYMGPVRLSDVESAQQKIVDIVRRLEDAGEIFVSGRGGESELVV